MVVADIERTFAVVLVMVADCVKVDIVKVEEVG